MLITVPKNINIPPHPLGETMKAIVFSKFGTNEVLELKTIPKPFFGHNNKKKPQPEVMIKVHAAGLNPIDKGRVGGGISFLAPEQYLDYNVLGYDASGVITEVSEDNCPFKIGDEVFVRLDGMNYGACAEYVCCNINEVVKKPTNISFVEAAAFPLTGLTSYQALKKGGVTEGSKVFIPGGSGGIGSMAIQIAKKVLKASYVCTTASPGIGTDICLGVGADRVVNYRTEKIEDVLKGEDFDMCFDTTNEGSKFGSMLKPNTGKVISITGAVKAESVERSEFFPEGEHLDDPVREALLKAYNHGAEDAAKSVNGTWDYHWMNQSHEDLQELANHLQTGDIKPVIDESALASSIEDYMITVNKLWSGRAKGKCVMKIA